MILHNGGKSSLWLFIEYYSPIHIFALFCALLAFQIIPILGEYIYKKGFALNLPIWGWGVMGVLSFLSVILLPSVAPQSTLNSACFETSLSLHMMPTCKKMPALPSNLPKSKQAQQLVQDYKKSRQNIKAPIHLQKYLNSITQKNNRPNVVLILLESVRARQMGMYGYSKHPTTPFMDKLAQKSLRFHWAFSNSNLSRYGVTALFGGRFGADPNIPRNFSIIEVLWIFNLSNSLLYLLPRIFPEYFEYIVVGE